MELQTLPSELLLIMISHLRGYEIERLALSLNRHIYSVCLPHVTSRASERRNLNEMIRRFQSVTHKGAPYHRREIFFHELGGEGVFGPSELQPPTSLEYQDMTGDLSWLQSPVSSKAHRSGGPDPLHCLMSPAKATSLRQQAKQLNVTLPDAFMEFMSRSTMEKCMPAQIQRQLVLGHSIRKCPPSVDQGAGGFLLKFMGNHNQYPFWALYLQAGGERGHAVLQMDEDPEMSDEDIRYTQGLDQTALHVPSEAGADGVRFATVTQKGFRLASTDFERWLQMTYFDGWLADEGSIAEDYREWNESEGGIYAPVAVPPLSDAQKDYIMNMCTIHGRNVGVAQIT